MDVDIHDILHRGRSWRRMQTDSLERDSPEPLDQLGEISQGWMGSEGHGDLGNGWNEPAGQSSFYTKKGTTTGLTRRHREEKWDTENTEDTARERLMRYAVTRMLLA